MDHTDVQLWFGNIVLIMADYRVKLKVFEGPMDLLMHLIEKNKIELNEPSKRFFLERPFDLRDAIHVCIIGDTSRDVYLERLYEMIGRLCAGPYIRFFHMPNKTGQRVINFNLGSNFHFQKLDQYLMR